VIVTSMRHRSDILRALLLVPLLAVVIDLARATMACGPGAETCLEAAGRGWLGSAGAALLLIYAAGLAIGIARMAGVAHGQRRRMPLWRSWTTGSLGLAAVCGGQAALAGALGDPTALGGGWLELLFLCALGGGIVAVALRAAPAATEIVRGLRPAVPRPRLALSPALAFPALPVRPARAPLTPATAGRAPPA
jgi:hypothetical protein